MANRDRGEVIWPVGSVAYRLRLTVQACAEVTGLTGRSFAAISKGVQQRRLTDIRALFWAGLRADYASLATFDRGLESVGALIDQAGVPASHRIASQLVALNSPEASDLEAVAALKGRPSADRRDGDDDRWRALYIDARQAGLSPEAFWGATLKELWYERAAHRQQADRQRERDLWMAWHIASFTRTERLHSLHEYMRAMKPQTPQERAAIWRDFAAARGIKVRKHNPKKYRIVRPQRAAS